MSITRWQNQERDRPLCHQPDVKELHEQHESHSRGADTSSDHHLVLCRLQLKPERTQQMKSEQLFNWRKLNSEAVKSQFTVELSNRLQVLDSTPADDTNALSKNVQIVFIFTSEAVLSHRRREKEECKSDATLQLIEGRKIAKFGRRVQDRLHNHQDSKGVRILGLCHYLAENADFMHKTIYPYKST